MAVVSHRLKINEIYQSIQGESSWAGMPCAFVRLTGCHLRCSYCDTEYAFHEGRWMTLDEIVEQVTGFGIRLVEITGGEPLLQPACGPLAQRLLDGGFTVLCETSGALPIDRLPSAVIRIMDLKCPSSGEVEANDWTNIDRLTERDEVKFVIGDRADYDWAVRIIRRHDLVRRVRGGGVLISPVFDRVQPARLVEWVLEDGLPVRVQVQLHKVIWEPDRIGV